MNAADKPVKVAQSRLSATFKTMRVSEWAGEWLASRWDWWKRNWSWANRVVLPSLTARESQLNAFAFLFTVKQILVVKYLANKWGLHLLRWRLTRTITSNCVCNLCFSLRAIHARHYLDPTRSWFCLLTATGTKPSIMFTLASPQHRHTEMHSLRKEGRSETRSIFSPINARFNQSKRCPVNSTPPPFPTALLPSRLTNLHNLSLPQKLQIAKTSSKSVAVVVYCSLSLWFW